MNQINTALISCIRAALTEESADCDVASCIGAAYTHGVTNLLYYAAAKMPKEKRPEAGLMSMLKQNTYTAIVRETMQCQLLKEIYRCFEDSKIRCVALKGVVLKELYPKPELRYMSDIDLLIDSTRASDVRKYFEELGCQVLNFDSGDTDHYLTADGLTIEVKKFLYEESFNPQTWDFLSKILSLAEPMEGYEFICRLPNEEHYVYLLCHMIKHLIEGGVGVRPVMDIWFCKNRMVMDHDKLAQLLSQLELTQFAATAEHLACVWFGDAEAEPLDLELGEYILGSGAFGTDQQRVVDRMLTKKYGKSKFSYIFARLFPPYKAMRKYYPVLQKIPVLLPVFWIWRMIFAAVYRRKKLTDEIAEVEQANSERLQKRAEFHRRCGINIIK